MFLLFLIRRGKFTTNPSPYGRIRQVQNTYSCHHFDAINSKLNWIIAAPGSAVLNKDLNYKCKETWYKFKFANAHWNLHFSPMVCACFYKHMSLLFVSMHAYVCAQTRGFLFCTSMRVFYMCVYHLCVFHMCVISHVYVLIICMHVYMYTYVCAQTRGFLFGTCMRVFRIDRRSSI